MKNELQPLTVRTAADLKRIRREQGFTMQSLADKLAVSREMVTRWESGKENLTLGTVERICSALDVQAVVLLQQSP